MRSIKLQFNSGDKVYFVHENRITEGIVGNIAVYCSTEVTDIIYQIYHKDIYGNVVESKINERATFPSLDGIVANLKSNYIKYGDKI